MTSKLRVPVPFPARVQGDGGIGVTKTSGYWVIGPKFSNLVDIQTVTDPASKKIWIWDEVEDQYWVMTLQGLGNSLYKATSTTSLAIGSGSKTFTTQANKDIAPGSWVLAVSDADTSNFMLGRVTAYSGTSLTLDVPPSGVGGSGTYADWTLIASGAPGVANPPGVRQTFDDGTTDADPGDGKFRFNNATVASATAAYLDNLDLLGSTVSGIFDRWDDSTNTLKGVLRFDKIGDPTIWAEFDVTGSIVDGTGYRKVTLENGAANGTFAGDFAITFTRSGDKGDQGDPGTLGGSTGSNDNRVLVADGTGGSTVKASAVDIDGSGNVSGVVGLSVTSIDVGNADTTITRAAAGKIAVEGVNQLGTAGNETLTGGFAATPYSAGTKSTGTFTPDPANGNFQYATNGGAHTLAPPSSACSIVLEYTNNGSAGAVTTSSFTWVTGDTLTTTNTSKFLLFITKHQTYSHLHVQALQ